MPRRARTNCAGPDLTAAALSSYQRWMTAALQEARLALETADVPVGAVVVDAAGDVHRRGAQRPGGVAGPDCPRGECWRLRAAAAVRGSWRLTGSPSWSRWSRARCAPGRRCWRVSTGLFTGPRIPKRRRGLALGRRTRPPAELASRSHRGRAGAGVRGPAAGFLCWPTAERGGTGPVGSTAVESRSGRARTPRKRVRWQHLRGFKSHLHRHHKFSCAAGSRHDVA